MWNLPPSSSLHLVFPPLWHHKSKSRSLRCWWRGVPSLQQQAVLVTWLNYTRVSEHLLIKGLLTGQKSLILLLLIAQGFFFSPEMSIWLLHPWKFAHCQMSSHVGAVSCSTPIDMANPWSLSSDRREEPIQGHWGFLLPVLRCPQCPGSVPVGNKHMNFIPIFMSRKFNYESMLWFSSWLWYLLFCFY